MRILHLIPHMAQGGAEAQLVNLLHFMNPHAQQHLVMIYPREKFPFFYEADVETLRIDFTFLNRQSGFTNRIPVGWRYLQTIRRFRPQIIHAHNWHAIDMARQFRRYFPLLRRVPLIANPHSLMDDKDQRRISIERRFWHHATHIVAVSKALAADYRQAVPECENRLMTIENGIDISHFIAGDRDTARMQLNLPQHIPIVLYAGRIHPEKNLTALIEAFRRLNHETAILLLVGRNDDKDYFNTLRKLTENLDTIRFLPEKRDMLPFYRACDFLVLPSLRESMGNVILESAACERPAMILPYINRNHLVQDGQTGWVVHGENIDALTDALHEALAASDVQRETMGRAARAHIIARELTLEHMANAYLNLYRESVKNR